MNRTHGHGGRKRSPTYTSWQTMKDRVRRDPLYKELEVCDRWQTFSNFLEDMGERPEGMTLDRIDNTKGYYKENCRWATQKQQTNNMRTNVVLEYKGEKHTMTEWSELLGLNLRTMYTRHNRGYCVEDILYKGNLQERNNKCKGYRPFRQSN